MNGWSARLARVGLAGAGATLALLVVVALPAQVACIIPPTAPALRHTGRLASRGAPGLVRAGATTDFDSTAGPDIGWRYRLDERIELDLSGYAMFMVQDEQPSLAALGRVGIGVGLVERERGALALLVGLGAGGLRSSYDDETPEGEPEHHEVSQGLVGGDVGLAGSLRFLGWLEPYLGARLSVVAAIDEDDSATVFWLMPAVGVRFLAHEWVAVSIEWTNGIFFYAESDPDIDWLTGASLGLEVGRNGSE
jgi:hypothetical protein